MLLDELKDYSNPACKLQRLVRDGKYTQVIRGLYESDPNTSGHMLATAIRSPSYLSIEYAPYHYDIIPERVYVFTSATYNTHRTKMYNTPFGTFTYRDSPKEAFHLGVTYHEENGHSCWIAEPVKAICDELYIKPPVSNYRELEELMFDDPRMDEDVVSGLDGRMSGCWRICIIAETSQGWQVISKGPMTVDVLLKRDEGKRRGRIPVLLFHNSLLG